MSDDNLSKQFGPRAGPLSTHNVFLYIAHLYWGMLFMQIPAHFSIYHITLRC